MDTSLEHSGAEQELIPGGLSYLLGGCSGVRVVVLNSLQVKHFINQTVYPLCFRYHYFPDTNS